MKDWQQQIYRIKKITVALLLAISGSFTSATLADTQYEYINANVGFANVNPTRQITGVTPLRSQAIKQASMTLAARGALAWRSIQINHTLNQESRKLSKIFNFNRLILSHNVLPPVIVESNSAMKLSGNNIIRTDSKTYQIIAAARFVTTPPSWRNYLYMKFCKPNLPDHSLFPKSEPETKLWNFYFQKGWKRGLGQANAIFAANLSRLKRDFVGMITYKKLLSEHMVNAPFTAESHMGVTGDNNELRINDRLIRITNPSKLQVNSKQWKPIFTG